MFADCATRLAKLAGCVFCGSKMSKRDHGGVSAGSLSTTTSPRQPSKKSRSRLLVTSSPEGLLQASDVGRSGGVGLDFPRVNTHGTNKLTAAQQLPIS